MPLLGFGTVGLGNAEEACSEAIKIGYRHLDSAIFYRNEYAVAQAAEKCESGWDSIFLTTKIPSSENGEKSLERSLSHTSGKPWDLVLLHEPLGGRRARHEAYKVLAEAQKNGKVKSIGVSNFSERHLKELEEANVGPIPAVNQLELHPWFQQKELVDYCQRNGIVV